MRKAIHVCLFKNGRNKWPKGRVALITKKKARFGTLGRTHGVIFPIFHVWVRTAALTYIPDFIQIGSGLGKLWPKSMSTRPKVNATGSWRNWFRSAYLLGTCLILWLCFVYYIAWKFVLSFFRFLDFMAALSTHLPGIVLPCGVLLHLCMLCISYGE